MPCDASWKPFETHCEATGEVRRQGEVDGSERAHFSHQLAQLWLLGNQEALFVRGIWDRSKVRTAYEPYKTFKDAPL